MKRLSFLFALAPVLGLPGLMALAGPARQSATVAKVDFNRDIRPILAANCFSCHGQDEGTRQAGLRLDQRLDAIARRSGKQAIAPGKPESSELVARIYTNNEGLLMPPPSSNHSLTAAQKRLLTEWVRQGAPYDTHWSFKPVKRPALPMVKNRAWGKNPIDAFVLARLEKAGLKPAPEADRFTLIRRVSLDLTGLPPTPKDVQTFVRDTSPGAYEKVVDRLLASPAYGEHWARTWLDLARYADTQGYEKDGPRTIWRYRDWVIDAFNADLPYDRFTIEQLAGDLLPHPTDSQILATAFHRNTMTNTEGGVDGEEFRVAAIKDRVDTTGQVWMGLTVGCAKCHSHKYDPIRQVDYYRFYGMFNQTEDANRGDEFPTAPLPTAEQKQRLAALDAKIKTLRAEYEKEIPEQKVRQAEWERSLAVATLWTPVRYEAATAESGSVFALRPDQAVVVSGKQAETDVYTLTFPLAGQTIKAIRLEALKDPSLPNGGPGRDSNDRNVVTSEFQAAVLEPGKNQPTPITLTNPRADFEQGGWSIANSLDGKGDTGWAWSPQNDLPHVAVFDLKTPLTEAKGKLILTIRQHYPRLQHGCFRISVSGAETALLKAESRSLSELAAIPEANRTPEQQRLLNDGFRQTHEPTAALYIELSKLEKERAAIDSETPRIPVLKELPGDKLRVTHIHRRGNFLDSGDPVTPAVLTSFGSLPAGAPANRLGAAQWLVSKENPLTPRVAVNRFWARFFGTGLVETEEDFGTQGTLPTHPELLDWLAVHFRDDLRWSMKKLCKTLVMSATYRQSGVVTPEMQKLDPRNTLLSRGPRFRLPAEVIRDQALSVAGLLSSRMHGPSVMPPQPDGIWRTVYSGMAWKTSPGEDRYRRALYTFWRRTSPYPSMTTFDAGSGEFCVVRRVRTNTPLQALVTLNDPAFVEAAGALGKRMLTVTGKSPKERIAYGFSCVLARPPKTEELTRLVSLYDATLRDFRRTPEAARSLLASASQPTTGETDLAAFAACTTVANVLLNLDEVLTKP